MFFLSSTISRVDGMAFIMPVIFLEIIVRCMLSKRRSFHWGSLKNGRKFFVVVYNEAAAAADAETTETQ